MIKDNFLVRVMLIGVCLLSQGQAQAKDKSVSFTDVKKESAEFIKTLKQYSFKQRDEAIKETQAAIEKVDGQIDQLENRIENKWDKMNKATQKKSRESLKALRKKRYKLSEWYGSMKNSSSSAWGQIKKGFGDAYKSLSGSWQKAKQEFDSES